jgi:P-type Ca2+ transporter type 2C
LGVHPFAFKPLQLASLVDPKSLETLEDLGGVGALHRGLGAHPTDGLSTETGSPPSHLASAIQSSEGVYRTSVEDRQRIFGQNILPRRPIKSLLQLIWLALKDKALVSSK